MSLAVPSRSYDSRPRLPSFWNRLRILWTRRETIRVLAVSALKAGHRDKVLGRLWSILDPLLFMLVFFFVFGILLRSIRGSFRAVDFMLYILIGQVCFRFIDGATNQASTVIRSNRGIIHEVNFPKAVFPLSLTLSHLHDFVIGILLLFAFLLAAGYSPTLYYLWVPVLVLITIVLVTGAALLVACIGVFFADASNIFGILMRLLLYCSPIFYFVRDRGGHQAAIHNPLLRFWYFKNPITCLIECWRDALLWSVPPQSDLLLYASAFSIALFLLGFQIFSANEGRFAKHI